MDQIPRAVKGTVQSMLDRKDELQVQDSVCEAFGKWGVGEGGGYSWSNSTVVPLRPPASEREEYRRPQWRRAAEICVCRSVRTEGRYVSAGREEGGWDFSVFSSCFLRPVRTTSRPDLNGLTHICAASALLTGSIWIHALTHTCI